jgi:membrane-bound lytic murein transglycosylase D
MHDCFKLGRLVYLVTALFIAAGAFGCTTAPTGSGKAAAQAEKTVASGQVQRPMYQNAGMAAYYSPPGRIDLCGEPVPLEDQDVMERFDKEFTLVVYNHAQVFQWLKRKQRHFPRLEEILRRLNLPDDLKYVAMVEIEPPLNSPRKKSVDMRYDFERYPESSFQYLGDLYRSFKSWPLAITAYNAGEKRIMDECRAQGTSDCFHLILPQETERYVFRILAMKVVLSDPARYGYELPKGAGSR